ncbi:hypothetical protein CCP4SC76_1030001 [Gammaproteobacteria bacterium]
MPAPFLPRVRILYLQGIRQINAGKFYLTVFLEQVSHPDGSSPLKLAVLMRIYMKMEDNLENKRNSAWLHQAEKAV